MGRTSRTLLGLALVAIGAWSLTVCPPRRIRQLPIELTGMSRLEQDVARSKPAWVDPSAHGAIAHISAMLALVVLSTGVALVIDSLGAIKLK